MTTNLLNMPRLRALSRCDTKKWGAFVPPKWFLDGTRPAIDAEHWAEHIDVDGNEWRLREHVRVETPAGMAFTCTWHGSSHRTAIKLRMPFPHRSSKQFLYGFVGSKNMGSKHLNDVTWPGSQMREAPQLGTVGLVHPLATRQTVLSLSLSLSNEGILLRTNNLSPLNLFPCTLA